MSALLKKLALVKVAVLFAVCLMLSGCGGSKVSKDNYEKIKDDMTLKQVEEILGSGKKLSKEEMEKLGGMKASGDTIAVYKWGDDNKYIVVTFMEDKMKFKTEKGL